MKIKSISMAVLATAILGLSSCGCSEKTVSYKEVQRYFVRNDVKDYSPRVITDDDQLNRYFGAATVMGTNGMPTFIDFDKENAIAIIEPETNRDTEIKIEGIRKQNDKVVVRYKVITSGDARLYSTVPCLLVKVSKKYGSNVEFVKE